MNLFRRTQGLQSRSDLSGLNTRKLSFPNAYRNEDGVWMTGEAAVLEDRVTLQPVLKIGERPMTWQEVEQLDAEVRAL